MNAPPDASSNIIHPSTANILRNHTIGPPVVLVPYPPASHDSDTEHAEGICADRVISRENRMERIGEQPLDALPAIRGRQVSGAEAQQRSLAGETGVPRRDAFGGP